MIARLLLSLLLLAVPTVVSAMTPPREVAQHIGAPQPIGSGDLSLLWMTVYTASLWGSDTSWTANAPFALSIVYDMDFTGQDLVDRTIDEMARNAPPEKVETYRNQLQAAFPDVAGGDRITGVFVPPDKTMFYHNGQQTTVIDDAFFARAFFEIWLGDDTSEPELRMALLGQAKP